MTQLISDIASKWLYDRPTLTINERAVVARFAQWLDERTADETSGPTIEDCKAKFDNLKNFAGLPRDPNYCPKCIDKGYCQCEIASNE